MKLKVLLPAKIFIDQDVEKVTCETAGGAFCFLPNHCDFVSAIVPGIVSFTTGTGKEKFIGVDQGIVVKCGDSVFISTGQAVRARRLGELRETIQEKYLQLSELEKRGRSATAKLESSFLHHIVEVENA